MKQTTNNKTTGGGIDNGRRGIDNADSGIDNGRRGFIGGAAKAGFAAAAAIAGGALTSNAAALTAKEEARRKKDAKYQMVFATAYGLDADRSYPIMQQNFKENVQNLSGGEIYVNHAHSRKLGAGAKLANKVQQGVIQVAQHSVSNFAPFAPAVDIINIPYWCATNQRFVNLVTSRQWKEAIDPSIAKGGFKALWYTSISARTFSVRKGLPPILSPDDMKGIKFRVPGSKTLQQYYRLLGANPTPVAWGETPAAIKQGVADALDPIVGALNIVGFVDIIDHITLAQSVHGGQVYSCNLEWFNSLPGHLQDAVEEASDITFRQNLATVPGSFAFAAAELRRGGVQIHSLESDAMAAFVKLAGHERPEWNAFKESALGNVAAFDKMLQAANTAAPARYTVDNV